MADDEIVTNKHFLHGAGYEGRVIGPSTGKTYPSHEGWYDVSIVGAPVRVTYVHESEMNRREQ